MFFVSYDERYMIKTMRKVRHSYRQLLAKGSRVCTASCQHCLVDISAALYESSVA